MTRGQAFCFFAGIYVAPHMSEWVAIPLAGVLLILGALTSSGEKK